MNQHPYRIVENTLFALLITVAGITLVGSFALIPLFMNGTVLNDSSFMVIILVGLPLAFLANIFLKYRVIVILAAMTLICVIGGNIRQGFSTKRLYFAIFSAVLLGLGTVGQTYIDKQSAQRQMEQTAREQAEAAQLQSKQVIIPYKPEPPVPWEVTQANIARRKAEVQAEADRRLRNQELRQKNIAIAKERYAYLTRFFATPRVLTETQEYGSLLFHDGDHVIRIDPIVFIGDKKSVETYNDPFFWRLDLYLHENLFGRSVEIRLPAEADFIRDYCCYNENATDEYFPAYVYTDGYDIAPIFQDWTKTHYNK